MWKMQFLFIMKNFEMIGIAAMPQKLKLTEFELFQ